MHEQARLKEGAAAPSGGGRKGTWALGIPLLLIVVALFLSAAYREPAAQIPRVQGADPQQGPATIQRYGCGACHTIGGVQGANGKVGPPLVDLGERSYIAGRLSNTPDNLVYWIMHPQNVDPWQCDAGYGRQRGGCAQHRGLPLHPALNC